METGQDIVNMYEDSEEKPETLPAVISPINSVEILLAASQKAGISIPDDKVEVLQGFMKAVQYGHQAALPMKCKGQSCPIITMCPLDQIGVDLPIGKSCPVEESMIEQWVGKYMDSMDIDPNDPEHAVDMHMIYEAAGLELIRMRTACHLSNEPEVVSVKIVGYSPTGQKIEAEVPSMALLLLEKQAKVMGKLREQMLATRRSQAQVGHFSNDITVRAANLREKAIKLAESRRKGGSVQDADFEVIEHEQSKEL